MSRKNEPNTFLSGEGLWIEHFKKHMNHMNQFSGDPACPWANASPIKVTDKDMTWILVLEWVLMGWKLLLQFEIFCLSICVKSCCISVCLMIMW